jgi:2-C-methyl-D-erythritol 4-phosphate cytidylyltransferase
MKIAVIIAAGGSGKRFGAQGGKQLFAHRGKPIVFHTIDKFVGLVDQIIVVIKNEDTSKITHAAVNTVVASGAERYDSVRNGLAAVRPDVEYVFIHDGARPNVTKELIVRLKTALREHDAVIPVIPVTDTIKVVRNNIVVETPKRSELFQVQTPQCFKKEVLLKAYASVNLADCTDDAMIVERAGVKVYTVLGDRINMKITTPEDVRYLS